jgi:hypothetical protein
MKGNVINYLRGLYTACTDGIGQTAFRKALESVERDLSGIQPPNVRNEALRQLRRIRTDGNTRFRGKAQQVIFDCPAIAELADYLEEYAALAGTVQA